MSAAASWLVPLVAFAIALGLALALNALVIARRPDRDSRSLWSWVLIWSLGLLDASLVYAWALQWTAAPWWHLGYHPLFDTTGLRIALPGLPPLALDPSDQRGIPLAWLALAVPFALWSLLVAIRLAMPIPARDPGQPPPGAWLIGAVGFDHSRRWVLWTLVPPLLLLLAWGLPDLGTGPTHMPAALWGALAVTAINLIVLAFSRGAGDAIGPVADTNRQAVPGDWVAALRLHGVAVRTLCRLDAQAAPDELTAALNHPETRALIEQWPLLRERRVAPELIEAIADLYPAREGDRRNGLNRLILAPDGAGQLECLAVAIQLTWRRLERVSLVIVPRDPDTCAGWLAPWLPGPDQVQVQRYGVPLGAAAIARVMEIGTLSEQLAELADNPRQLDRIGLVVWWGLDDYSGVKAANVWAIAHRLDRLVRAKGHQETRSLTFARAHQGHASNLAPFVAQLLPYDYRAGDRVLVQPRPWHPIAIHCLEPDADLRLADPAGLAHWDLGLIALRASVEAGWQTCLEPPPYMDALRVRDWLQQRVRGRRLADQLAPEPAEAQARILAVGPAEVLGLLDRLAQGGRVLGALPVQQVGLLPPPAAPYVRYLLERLEREPATFLRQARRLVPGAPQPAIVRRHLLLALREMEAVSSELLETFQWHDTILDPVLEELANRHEIERRDLRYLDPHNRLRVETGYRSAALEYRAGPLETVGDRLVAIVQREAGGDEALVQRIDPERATIVAYPGCVVRVRGQTYRMNPWPASRAEEVRRQGVLYCTRTDDPVLTWRISEPRLRRPRLDTAQPLVFLGQGSLSKAIVQTQYEEEITGILEVRPGPAGWRQTETLWGEPIEGLAFPTQGLLLRFLPEDLDDRPAALHSIAQALGQVLAVHCGVEEDAVLVTAVTDLRLGRRRESGLVILDLYPGGIGLIEALNDDALLRLMLEQVRDWLADCPCDTEAGCPRCLQSPPAIAATRGTAERRLSRRQAVDVLRQVLGR